MRKLPPLNALKAYEACARKKSFTLAADDLLVSQSAVSRQVKSLEDYLGVKLIIRQPKQITLTEHGEKLLSTLSTILDELASVTSTIQRKRHELRIKMPPTFAIRWLIPKMKKFQDKNPDVSLMVSTGWVPVDFDKEDFDTAIVCSTDLDLYDDTTETALIVQEELTPICSPGLLRDGPPLKRPADLLRFPLLHGSESSNLWKDWFEAAGIEFDGIGRSQIFDLMDSAIQAAVRSFGVALAPRQFVEGDLAAGSLIAPFPELKSLTSGYHLISPKSSASALVRKFRHWLFDIAQTGWDEGFTFEGLDLSETLHDKETAERELRIRTLAAQ